MEEEIKVQGYPTKLNIKKPLSFVLKINTSEFHKTFDRLKTQIYDINTIDIDYEEVKNDLPHKEEI